MRRLILLALGAPGALFAEPVGPAVATAEGWLDSMRVEIVVPRRVAAGAPVPMAIRIANTTRRPLELHLQGRSAIFDLTVRRGDTVVWRRLEGEAVQAILQLRTLAPGEALVLEETWHQKDDAGKRVGPGEYTVSGTVPTDGAPIEAGPARLTIEG